MSAALDRGNADESPTGNVERGFLLRAATAAKPAQTSLDRVYEALEAGGRHPERKRRHVQARCPLHEDVKPSLSIDWTSDHDGRILIHCFACNAQDVDVLDAIGLGVPDLFDQPPPPRDTTPKTRARKAKASTAPRPGPLPKRLTADADAAEILEPRHAVRTYEYTDEAGNALGRVVRFEWVTAQGPEKEFTQERPDGNGGWERHAPTRKVLRHLPAVVEAIAHGREIWLVEGEKDDESVNQVLPRSTGVATTNAGGAGNFGELWEQLAGAHVVIAVDRDGAGYRRAAEVARRLETRAASIRVVLPAVVEPHADVSDHLASGRGLGDMLDVPLHQLPILLLIADIEAAARNGVEAAKRARTCQREVSARLAAAEEAANRGATKAAAEERRFALRWAQEAGKAATRAVDKAAEAFANRTKLAGQVEQLTAQLPSGVDTTTELVARAERAQLDAQQVVAQTWAQVEAPIPEAIAAVVSAPAPSQAALVPDRDVPEPPIGLPPAPPKPPTGGRGGGGGGRAEEIPNLLPRYVHRHGETVYVAGTKDKPTFSTVWRCEVSVIDQMVDDDGDKSTPDIGGRWRLRLRRPARDDAGVVLVDEQNTAAWEEAEIELPPDKVRDGSWHEDLPWPGLVHDLSNKGRTTALQAALLAKPMPVKMARRYTATGWRTLDGRDVFVHAGGGIDAAGSVDLPHIAIDGKLDVFRMHKPTQDVEALREAVRLGLSPLLHLPASIIAPLIGISFRAVFGTPQASLHLVGEPGSGKTSITRIASMHWFAPAMKENGRGARKHVFSALEDTGETIKGLLHKMNLLADLPALVDDFKGPKGAAKLATLQSAIWNGGGRSLATRNGGSITTGAPRCTPITTGETSSTGSSATRALTIRVGSDSLVSDGDLNTLMSSLERESARSARGLLGASFIQWVAGLRESLTEWLDQLEEESPYIEDWNRVCRRLDHEPGVRGRLARTAMVCTTGWAALLTWLLEIGVMTQDQANTIWAIAMDGLIEQVCQQDPSAVDGPRHLLDLLRSALLSGACHLSDQYGSVPGEIREATSMDVGVPYGWTPRQSLTGPIAETSFRRDEVIWQARGERVGILTDTEVWLMPRPVLGVVNSVAGKAGETFPHSSVSIGSAMAGRGWIQANGAGDRSANRRVATVQQRVWVMPRKILDGVEDDRPENPTDLPPLPMAPWETTGDLWWDAPGRQEPTPAPSAAMPAEATDTAAPASTAPEAPLEPHPEPEHPEQEPPSAADDTAEPEAAPTAVVVDEPTSTTTVPTPRPAATQGRADDRWQAAAAVVTEDELVLPDGTHVHLDPAITQLWQLAEFAARLRLGHGGGKHVMPSPGQILLTSEGMTRFGIDLDREDVDELIADPDAASDAVARAGADAAAAVTAAGWRLSSDDQLRVWTRVWRPKTETQTSISMQVVLVPLMAAFDSAATLTGDSPTPEVLARRAQMVAETLSVTWGASGGVTGLSLLRTLRPAKGRALVATEYVSPPPPMVRDPGQVPNSAILWCRSASTDEAGRGWIHSYDANAMYLAAIGATEVGVGASVHHPDGTEFSAKVAGLWRIDPGTRPDDWRLPDIARPAGSLAGRTGWYSTPVIRYLVETGQTPEILEAYTWPDTTRRYFDRWTEVVRDARSAMLAAAADGDPDAPIVLDAIKATYTRLIGRFARQEDAHNRSELYRPDWRLAIVSTANANLLRKLRTAGQTADQWPVAISTDEVFYLSDEPDPVVALPAPLQLGDSLGKFKVTRSAPATEEMRHALTTGRLSQFLPLVPKLGDR